MGNKGAFITLKAPDLKPNFTSYDAVVSSHLSPLLVSSCVEYSLEREILQFEKNLSVKRALLGRS